MLKGFRNFVFRGNVIDLAVGVIIGASFGAVVTSLTSDVLTPLIGAIFGQPDFSALMLGPIAIGNLLNALISFLLTALALYFLVVLPLQRLMPPEPVAAPPPSRTCPECLSAVPLAARRCAFCTSSLDPVV